MNNDEKFEGFKRKIIEDNEKIYGAEARARYGDGAVDASNANIMGLTCGRYAEAEELSRRINDSLKTAFKAGDPAGELAQKVCEMHRQWLGYFWNNYSREAHLGLAQLYVDDPRFTKYYDDNAARAAPHFFLKL